jgi:membrane protease YdiL (CAAX protease family)
VPRRAADDGVRGTIRGHRLAAFGVLVVLFTLGVAALGLGPEVAPFALVFVPAIAAMIVATIADGLKGVRRIFARLTRWRVAPRWYAAALGIPLIMWLGVDLAGIAIGHPPVDIGAGLAQLPVVALVVLIPAFVEEAGWRGYAVPAAPRSWPLLVTALVVGGLFIIPHLALYLPGGLYDDLPLWPLPLILLSGSVLFTWAFVGSGGSALVAALMHAASNALTPLSRGMDPVIEWQLHGLVITAIAIAVVVLSKRFRPAGTTGSSEVPGSLALSESPA